MFGESVILLTEVEKCAMWVQTSSLKLVIKSEENEELDCGEERSTMGSD